VFRYIVILCAVLSSASTIADAQPESLTIADAVALISSRHPAISALDTEIQVARAMRQQAEIRPNPEVAAGLGYKETDTDEGYALDVELSFPIERGGKREARIGIAESDIQIAEASLQQLQRDIELQVRTIPDRIGGFGSRPGNCRTTPRDD
jgi:outer membrane protein, heavy metal efflux system